MNRVNQFYEEGKMTINVIYKPLENAPIICIKDGKWYKFNIDEIEELEDKTYNVTSHTLLSIDDKMEK